MVSPDFLMALAHTEGYVALAELPTQAGQNKSPVVVGGSFGFLAHHAGTLGLHSHITGVLPSHQHLGLGQLLKQHQRSWALSHNLSLITWTFDPLVRRNGWFNLHRLGATAEEYHINFYGPLGDAINGDDDTDRLLARWDLQSARTKDALQGTLTALAPQPKDLLVPTPPDIVALRHDDPSAARAWRLQLRQALNETMSTHRVIGMTAEGDYVLRLRD
jgi:predicted GNAT superfamily acetyltransferase